MQENIILSTEIITAIGSIVTTVIAVMGFMVAQQMAIPLIKETHEKALETHKQTIELVKQTTEIAVHTNSLTEKLLEKTDAVARVEAVKGERARIAEGRPEDS